PRAVLTSLPHHPRMEKIERSRHVGSPFTSSIAGLQHLSNGVALTRGTREAPSHAADARHSRGRAGTGAGRGAYAEPRAAGGAGRHAAASDHHARRYLRRAVNTGHGAAAIGARRGRERLVFQGYGRSSVVAPIEPAG